MNILVSYNWLKEYLKTDLKPEEFAARLSLCGPSVERIHQKNDEMKHIVVGKILNIKKHPNADKLHLVEVDIGKKRIEVVCGGSNLRGGMKVAVALSGAKVRWHGEGDPVELKPTEIRGVKSEGMICAADEIGFGAEFPKKEDPTSREASRGGEIMDLDGLEAKPGTPLAEALNLKDTIFDMEVTTNRPDAMCISGIAREAGTILKVPFTPPEIKYIKQKNNSGLKIKVEAPDLCYRYQAVVIEGVKIKESPWWLKQKLASVGTRSINNVVDVTNFVLWEMGQPLHAFDYDKLEGKKIIVRRAKKGEKIKALDGNNYKLKEEMLVIADAKNPCAIAGVMGGEESGVSEKTKAIVLESAVFNPVSIRRTSRALNLRSDSSDIFEKGLSPEATAPALARAANLIMELAGGYVASQVFDIRSEKSKPRMIALSAEKANSIIGEKLGIEEMADILERLGFFVSVKDNELKARAPYWRKNDMEIPEDLIEEIARVYGYHRLPSVLPGGSVSPEPADKNFEWEKIAKTAAIASGYDEVLPYTMIGEKMMKNMGESRALRLANPLSLDLEYMRVCLLPGLLQVVAENENNFVTGKIFELGRVYPPGKKGELPEEGMHFAGLSYGLSPKGELYYQSKGFVEEMLSKFGVDGCEFKTSDDKNFHPARAIDIYKNKNYIGSFGEIHPEIAKKFGINCRVGFFYFYFAELLEHAKSHKTYSPVPEFPGIKRDISFVVDKKTEYNEIEKTVFFADPLIAKVEPFDVYEGKGVPENKKSMALHLLFRSNEKTLEMKEADESWQKITALLKKEFSADIRQ